MIVLMKCLNEGKVANRVLSDFHNEEWVSRIIVIDGGSTDYTVQECRQFEKVEVYIHPWIDWYHNMEVCQSNIALSYVPNGELAFILDFDERMNDRLREFLAGVNKNGYIPNTSDIGHVPRKTYELMRHEDSPFAVIDEDGWPIISHQIGQFPDYQCRLIHKNRYLHWINSPHHVMEGQRSSYNLPVETDAYVVHYEKDDYRDRQLIEIKWLRNQARRKYLGIDADIFETKVKPELAKYADPAFWGWK